MKKKNIVILGSSGSIGENALDIIRQFKDRFRVIGLSVNVQIEKLARQIREFKPEYVAIRNEAKARELDSQLRRKTKVLVAQEGLCQIASLKEADLVLIGIVGSEAIFPLLSAIKSKKTVALANKESIVIGGEIVLKEAIKNKVKIIPVDSEQNAIFQCLEGYSPQMVERIYLTASGGPLIDYSSLHLRDVSLKKVLAHPRWKMGRKITVDSATLMNKGLEVIETQQLFNLELRRIKVIIHRQALIHAMVEFIDGVLLAQMATTDMRIPIQYALTYPQRWSNSRFRLDPLRISALSFSEPDDNKFPCLALAYEAARLGGTAACALNAANEVAVAAFLEGRLAFGGIPRVIEKIIKEKNFRKDNVTLEDIFETDKITRLNAGRWVSFYQKRGFRQ